MEGKIGGIVVLIIIASIITWSKFSNKDDFKQEFSITAHQVIETIDDYAQHPTDYDYYFQKHHEQAFEHNYLLGGKLSDGKFNEDDYWQEVFDSMIKSAESDRQTEIAEIFRDLQTRILQSN